MKYKLKVALRTAKTKGLLRATYLLCLIVRSFFVSRRRLILGLDSSEIKSFKVTGYKIERLKGDEEFLEECLKELSSVKQYIPWDVKDVLETGGNIWLGRYNNQLATIAVSKTGDKKTKFYFPLADDTATISHAITFPEFRGLRLFTANLTFIMNVLAGENIKYFYEDPAVWNMPSIRGLQRAGFRLIGKSIVKKNGELIYFQTSPSNISGWFDKTKD